MSLAAAAAAALPAEPAQPFDRTARLLGAAGLERLRAARVYVFGLGGVGSWAAEALARCGVGSLVLVDFDVVSPTNLNRQLQATAATLGRPKAEALAERLRLVSPHATIEARAAFWRAETADELLPPSERPDYVVDAMDKMKFKLELLARCIARGLPTVSSMGAAGRLDPSKVRVVELCDTYNDQFAKDVRKLLRLKHGVDTSVPCGVRAVFSPEHRRPPERLPGDEDLPPAPAQKPYEFTPIARIEGTVAFVTAAFGMAAAGLAVREMAAGRREDLPVPKNAGHKR